MMVPHHTFHATLLDLVCHMLGTAPQGLEFMMLISCVTTNAALLLNWQFCQQSPKQNGSTKGAQTCEQRWRETVPCKAT